LTTSGRTGDLANTDRAALRAVAERIKTVFARPNKDIGHAGPMCPFVPGALERSILWLAPEQIGGRAVPEMADLINSYQRLFLDAQPIGGDDAVYKSIVVVLTDLSADRAGEFFDALLDHLAVPSYVDDGFVMGGFFEGNEATAIYNPSFRPFISPVPFLLVRHAVISDWKFFLAKDDWLRRWADRYPESGIQALAEELRRLPWNVGRNQANTS
jgi:hypothetical protein